MRWLDLHNHKFFAALWASFLALALLSLSACTHNSGTSHTVSIPPDSTVDIITPFGNNSLDPAVPINTWSQVTDKLKKTLVDQGFTEPNVHISRVNNSDAQVNKIDDLTALYSQSSHAQHTLIVAPALKNETSVQHSIRTRYGDLVTLPANKDNEVSKALTTSLTRAQDNKIRVIVLANEIPNFTPDYFVTLSTASDIARIQTNYLIRKLDLNAATREHPKAIEILLPINVGADFDQELFEASWKILKPYFNTGVAYSPSGLLTRDCDVNDWRNVSFVDDSPNGVTDALRARLTRDDGKISRIDGILAFNDYTAYGVTSALDQLGFTGSSTSVNPEITLDNILKNFTGHADINRQEVPAPQSEINSSPSSDNRTYTYNAESHAWPIVTGYGSYISTVDDIVNGKVWITTLEDRTAIAESVATLASILATGRELSNLSDTLSGLSGNHLTMSLFAVNADNFKKTMLDSGYINPADAGL